jgi:hypothetical protein
MNRKPEKEERLFILRDKDGQPHNDCPGANPNRPQMGHCSKCGFYWPRIRTRRLGQRRRRSATR